MGLGKRFTVTESAGNNARVGGAERAFAIGSAVKRDGWMTAVVVVEVLLHVHRNRKDDGRCVLAIYRLSLRPEISNVSNRHPRT